MTIIPELTEKGIKVLDASVKEFHAPRNRHAEFPSRFDESAVLRVVMFKFATEKYGYDDYAEEGALELLESDVKRDGEVLDIEEVREANSNYEMDINTLSGEMTIHEFVQRWENERDSATVLRFFQAARSGFEEVLDADPGSSTWDPEAVYGQIFTS